jgi:hypothetical protein
MGRIGKRRGIGRKKKVAAMREQMIREQLEAFRAKFGRDPKPGEPVFFDPDEDEPVPLSEEKMMNDTLAEFAKAGLPAHHAYAYKKTGRLLMEASTIRPRWWPSTKRRSMNTSILSRRMSSDVAFLLPRGDQGGDGQAR